MGIGIETTEKDKMDIREKLYKPQTYKLSLAQLGSCGNQHGRSWECIMNFNSSIDLILQKYLKGI